MKAHRGRCLLGEVVGGEVGTRCCWIAAGGRHPHFLRVLLKLSINVLKANLLVNGLRTNVDRLSRQLQFLEHIDDPIC